MRQVAVQIGRGPVHVMSQYGAQQALMKHVKRNSSNPMFIRPLRPNEKPIAR